MKKTKMDQDMGVFSKTRTLCPKLKKNSGIGLGSSGWKCLSEIETENEK